jgi:aldose 1-epimerase
MNFPGNMHVEVTFKLLNSNAIDINYQATTDKKTVINMTNHSYFNLSGDASKTTIDHLLYVNADQMTPIDETVGVTGEIVKVDGTPFDFRTPHAISEEINKDDAQIKYANGIDHNFVLNTAGSVSDLAASLYCPETGIKLEVFTNEPGIQIYTGNFLNGRVKGKKGIAYQRRNATCLETQKFPNSPNHPEWPSAFLEPGQTYHSECVYKFSVE